MHLDALLGAVSCTAVREHDDRARRMTEREVGDAPCGAACVLLAVGVHDEIQHRRARDRSPELARMRALRPTEPRELALERRDATLARSPERRVDHYAFRHFRPSRSMRASASVGPHVPAS